MKKTVFIVLGMFVLSSFSFAGEGKFAGKHKNMDPEQKAKWEAMKKEKAEYFKNLEILVNKYNAAADEDKGSVKQEIAVLVANQTDKNIAAKKDMVAAKKEEIVNLEASISEMESDKTAYVGKKVDFFLSEEGQEKIQKMKNKKDCGKDYKKDCKKGSKKGKKDCQKDKKDCKKDKSKKKSK